MTLIGAIIICAGVSFAGAFWIISCWFDRKLSGRESVLLLVGLLAVECLAMAMPGAGLLVLAAAVVGGAVLIRMLAGRAERRLASSFEQEDIAKYREAMELDPKNVAAHSLLADTYRRRGELELAIQEYQAALGLDPSLRQERYWVQQLEAQLDERARKGMRCPRCGAVRPPAAQVCPECDRWYSTAETSLHAVRTMSPGRKLAWAGLIAAGLVAVAAGAALAPRAAGFAALSLFLLVPIALIVASIRASRREG